MSGLEFFVQIYAGSTSSECDWNLGLMFDTLGTHSLEDLTVCGCGEC